MRPVTAPNHAIGGGLDDGSRHRLQALEISVLGQAVGRRQLDPATSATEHAEKPLKVGVRQTIAFKHVAHVVNDEISVQCAEERKQIANHPPGSVELDMPADGPRAPHAVLDIGDDVGSWTL